MEHTAPPHVLRFLGLGCLGFGLIELLDTLKDAYVVGRYGLSGWLLLIPLGVRLMQGHTRAAQVMLRVTQIFALLFVAGVAVSAVLPSWTFRVPQPWNMTQQVGVQIEPVPTPFPAPNTRTLALGERLVVSLMMIGSLLIWAGLCQIALRFLDALTLPTEPTPASIVARLEP